MRPRAKPSTGSVVGGTIVTVTGRHFTTFMPHPITCKFGEMRSITTIINDNTLECLSPPATAAGQQVAIAFDADFDETHDEVYDTYLPPGEAQQQPVRYAPGLLYGHAQLAYGILELTPGYYFQTGTYHLGLEEREAPLPWWRLSVYVSIQPGYRNLYTPVGGMGFSLSFGALPDAPFGELGAGDGLRLCFLTTNSTLTAHYSGRYLGNRYPRHDRRALGGVSLRLCLRQSKREC